MKQKIRRYFMQFALVLLALLPLFPGPVSAVEAGGNPTVRVGLFYGSSALAGANLLNRVGSGYRLGYFDFATDL